MFEVSGALDMTRMQPLTALLRSPEVTRSLEMKNRVDCIGQRFKTVLPSLAMHQPEEQVGSGIMPHGFVPVVLLNEETGGAMMVSCFFHEHEDSETGDVERCFHILNSGEEVLLWDSCQPDSYLHDQFTNFVESAWVRVVNPELLAGEARLLH